MNPFLSFGSAGVSTDEEGLDADNLDLSQLGIREQDLSHDAKFELEKLKQQSLFGSSFSNFNGQLNIIQNNRKWTGPTLDKNFKRGTIERLPIDSIRRQFGMEGMNVEKVFNPDFQRTPKTDIMMRHYNQNNKVKE